MRVVLFIGLIVIFISCDPVSTQLEGGKSEAPETTNQQEKLTGSWKSTFVNDTTGLETTIIAIVTDKHFSNSLFSLEERTFVGTYGGSWKLEGDKVSLTYEYHTLSPSLVGETRSREFEIESDVITFLPDKDQWARVDDGTPGQLFNAWLITGRKRDGEMNRITPGVRRTMKILSGTRFQWIAYNIETADFFGTGGGTYTSKNGKYVENIEFFSRNADRVGASLEFDFEVKDGEWHHSGLSSRGQPIYEIWTPRSRVQTTE